MARSPLTSIRSAFAAVLVSAIAACGSEPSERLALELPHKRYALSSNEPLWKHPPPGVLRNDLTCGATGRVASCCPPPGHPTFDCAALPLACDGGVCALVFELELARTVELAVEVPELGRRRGRVLSVATPPSLRVESSSRLNVALPEARLYLAPGGVRSGRAEGAKLLGVIPRIEAGVEASSPIRLGGEAATALARAISDYQTPFNLIVTFPIVTRPDTPPPVGDAELTVTGSLAVTF
jgi:hypothetical protein